MYHLATMHSITDRQTDRRMDGRTDRRHYDANSWLLHAVWLAKLHHNFTENNNYYKITMGFKPNTL